MRISDENKALARYLRGVLGGDVSVDRYWDEGNKSSVDILTAQNAPSEGIATYATVGLSGTPSGLTVGDLTLGVELLLSARDFYRDAPNILSTCAFEIINSKSIAKPGVVFPGVVEIYRPNTELKHALFVAPFLWKLETQDQPGKKITWLFVVPISDAEYVLLRRRGSDALEDIFEEEQIDVFDLDRRSVV